MIDIEALLTRQWPDGHPPGLPWHDPEFSRRMLAEHLDQTHDMASRRSSVIEDHIETLDGLIGEPATVVDLGCGPGIYTRALAERGHTCLGIDIGPAAIDYARAHAVDGCEYVLGDVLDSDLGTGRGAVMMLFGQIDTFAPGDVDRILASAHRALASDGLLVLEVHRRDHVEAFAGGGPRWWTGDGGLFADGPHLVLQEHRWTGEFADTRHLVITDDGHTEYLHRTYATAVDEWRDRLEKAGFHGVADGGPFTDEEVDSAFRVLSARRRG